LLHSTIGWQSGECILPLWCRLRRLRPSQSEPISAAAAAALASAVAAAAALVVAAAAAVATAVAVAAFRVRHDLHPNHYDWHLQ
jgi:hypothetical protein